jgi:hypothetical protein
MVSQPLHAGNPGRAKTGGRQHGSANILTQKALLDLAKEGGDPPHIALLKIGRNTKNPLSVDFH